MHREKGKQNTPQIVIDEIVKRHEAGESVPALAKIYGKPFKTVRNMVYRERKKQQAIQQNGILPWARKRGRKPAVTLSEYKYENARLRMENELLRDFLQLTGRK